MAQPGKRKLIYDELMRRVQRLAIEASGGAFPIPLEKVASAVSVHSVLIEPLLSDGGLERMSDGWRIWLNSDGRGMTSPAGASFDVKLPEWPEFKAPVRFVMAHELSHVVYIQLEGEYGVDGQNGRLDDLEAACNAAAGAMLLPAKLARVRVEGDNVFNVDLLFKLIQEANVSAEVLLLRLGDRDFLELPASDTSYGGLIAYIERVHQGELSVVAFQVWGAQAKTRFGDPKKTKKDERTRVRLLRSWRVADHIPSSAERSLPATGKRIDIPGTTGIYLPCEMRWLDLGSPRYGSLLSLRVLGPPKQRSFFDKDT